MNKINIPVFIVIKRLLVWFEPRVLHLKYLFSFGLESPCGIKLSLSSFLCGIKKGFQTLKLKVAF